MRVIHEQRGQGLVEYALLLIFIAMVLILILAVFGDQVANFYSQITSRLGSLP
jgi:Flp pilus assembly pilin Flp